MAPRAVGACETGLCRDQQYVATYSHDEYAEDCSVCYWGESQQDSAAGHAKTSAPYRGAAPIPAHEPIAQATGNHGTEGEGAEVQTRNGVAQMEIRAQKGHQRAEDRLEKGEVSNPPVGGSSEMVAMERMR